MMLLYMSNFSPLGARWHIETLVCHQGVYQLRYMDVLLHTRLIIISMHMVRDLHQTRITSDPVSAAPDASPTPASLTPVTPAGPPPPKTTCSGRRVCFNPRY